MGKRGPQPRYVDTTWTPELAYVVGMIASDGNLGRDGMYIDVSSADRETIETVKNILCLDNKIGTKNNGAAYRIQFKSKGWHTWLQEIGLTPCKSKTLGCLEIPDAIFFDFLRGVWDGDGCIYSYFDPRWRSSFMFYISFASASPIFLSWLQQTVERLAGIKGKITGPAKSTYQLRFAKETSTKLFKKMFHCKGVPHLPRKLAKAQKIFKLDRDNNKQRLLRLSQ